MLSTGRDDAPMRAKGPKRPDRNAVSSTYTGYRKRSFR